MNKRFWTQLGWCLLTAGTMIYAKNMIYDVFWFSPRNDFGHLYCAGFLADRGGDFFNPELMRRTAAQNRIERLNPFVYPPFFAMVLIPLSRVSYDQAWMLFNLLSHAAFFAALGFLVRIFRKKDEPLSLWWGGLLLASALFVPLQKNYMAGQMNTFMLLVLAAGYYSYTQKKTLCTGAIFGIGAAIKIAPGFFLLYLLYKRQWKAATASAAVLLCSFALSLSVLGWEVHRHFLDEVRQMSYGSSTWAHLGMKFHIEPHNQAPSALWYRLLTHNPTTTGILDTPAAAQSLSVLSALAVFALLAWYTLRNTVCSAREIALWSFGMLWIPSLMWDHYLVQLIFALIAAWRFIMDGSIGWAWLLGLGIALMGMDYPYNFDYPPYKSGWMVLMMNLKLYGSILVAAFLLMHRDQNGTISTSMTPPSSGS